MHVFTENNSEDINQNFNCDFSLGGWYSIFFIVLALILF